MSAPAGTHGGPWLTGEALLAALRRLDPADRVLQVWLADPLAPDGYVRAVELAIGEDPDPAAGDPDRFLVVTTCDRADRAGPPSRRSKSRSAR